jgi:hypothetical protein
MSKKIGIALIVVIVLIFASVTAFYMLRTPTNTGSPVTTGLNIGDVFIYQMVGFADSPIGLSTPESFVDINNTKHYRVEITDIDIPIVSYTVSWEFNNGTTYSDDGMINLETGSYLGYYWNIYASDLSVGSLCRIGNEDEPTINSTQVKTYPDGDREVNFLSISYTAYDIDDSTYTNFCYVFDYVYFDKQTGIMVAYETMRLFNYPEISLTVEYKLVEYKIAGSSTVKVPDSINFFS